MLVHLHQYRTDEAKETVRSDGSVDPDHDTEDYFGLEGLDADEGWERTSYGDRTLLRRAVTFDSVTAVSTPREDLDETADEVPGHDVQIRRHGDTDYVKQARIVAVEDQEPDGE